MAKQRFSEMNNLPQIALLVISKAGTPSHIHGAAKPMFLAL